MKKVDILSTPKNLICSDCGDPFGVIYALNGGVCTEPSCFACILHWANGSW